MREERKNSIPPFMLNSKLINNEQWEEYLKLKKESLEKKDKDTLNNIINELYNKLDVQEKMLKELQNKIIAFEKKKNMYIHYLVDKFNQTQETSYLDNIMQFHKIDEEAGNERN